MIYVTSAATYTVGRTYGLRLSINKATTGTVTIADADGIKGVIAATTAAQDKQYHGFNGSVTVTTSAAEDITISALGR